MGFRDVRWDRSEVADLVDEGLCEMCLLDYRGFGWPGNLGPLGDLSDLTGSSGEWNNEVYHISTTSKRRENARYDIYIWYIYPYWKRVILVITWDFRGFPFWDGWHINQRWIKYFVVNPMLKNQLPMIPRNSLNVCKTVESLFQVLWNIIICRTLRVKYFLVLMLDTTENDDIHFRTFLWFISYPLLKSKTPEITPFRCERINNQSNFNSLLIMLTPHPWFCWTDRSSFTVETQ